MKKSGYKTVFNIYFKFFIVFLILILIFIGIDVYLIRIDTGSENSYINWSSQPISFTAKFSSNIYFNDGKPRLKDSGINELKKYNLFFQIADENGEVAFGYNEPNGTLKHYAPIEMVQLYKNGSSVNNYTMFVGGVDNNGEKWTYIIGFPAKISKITMYLNYDKVSKIKFVVLGMVVIIMLFITAYSVRTSYILSNIIMGIEKLSSNSYIPMKENGVYHDVNKSLNLLNDKLKNSEAERKKNETLREEWIANISHDLKTPLSPIKGYAEILTDSEYTLTSEDAKKYGMIILNNAKSIESIVENLNFTYQLKNGMLPMNKKDGNMVRLFKEVIISILNNPEYEERNIMFSSSCEKADFNFDDTLLRRAFTNLLYNSVIHNTSDTAIKVSVKDEDKIYINIEDNGKGMTEEDLKKLFERYYRGTNSKVSVKGSGLGMAIAKQIIEAHGGKICIDSRLNVGTSINIEFPKGT